MRQHRHRGQEAVQPERGWLCSFQTRFLVQSLRGAARSLAGAGSRAGAPAGQAWPMCRSSHAVPSPPLPSATAATRGTGEPWVSLPRLGRAARPGRGGEPRAAPAGKEPSFPPGPAAPRFPRSSLPFKGAQREQEAEPDARGDP